MANTGTKYGKFDGEGKLVYAPSILKPSTGGFLINPSEDSLRKEGYLPVDEVIPLHDDNDLVILDHYEIVDGRIVVTYKVVEISDSDEGATPEEVAELEERIATLTSQNAILASQKAELAAANETLATDVEAKEQMAQSYQDMYFDEHGKVYDLEETVAEWKGKYEETEELREQRDFYQNAAIKANYLDYIDRQTMQDSILCYGPRDNSVQQDESDDDETKFYKKAHIISKVEFVPLKLYRVTDGEQVRWLVYTPPGRTVSVGGIPYPIVEAHGGDWVELKFEEDESSSNSEVTDIVVYNWQDSDGNMHIGTKVPDDALAHTTIAVFPVIEDSSSES